ncbi:competence type IV pilus minor pilin ComGF [Streptococcus dentapri]|uniref:Competence type IV pilus minor pilin ComGF n=1 Tax=Streptococcus dentapri TaxID=573564 RepID=A0ABV8D1L3_9STRE
MWLKDKIRAFTLLECLVALLVISGSVLVYQGLSEILSSNVSHISKNDEEDWLLFCQQLRSELSGSSLDRITDNKLYVTKGTQSLAFGKSRSDDFRKTNADGRGYQPMLYHVVSAVIHQQNQMVTITITFESGLERTFVYAFEEKG